MDLVPLKKFNIMTLPDVMSNSIIMPRHFFTTRSFGKILRKKRAIAFLYFPSFKVSVVV